MNNQTLERFMGEVDVSPVAISKALKRPSNFIYMGGDERIFDTWVYGPVIETRDSDPVDRSNARVLVKMLSERYPDEYYTTDANHWGVGWVTHLCYRVKDDSGNATSIFRFISAWFRYLKEVYAVADEMDLSELESEYCGECGEGLNDEGKCPNDCNEEESAEEG